MQAMHLTCDEKQALLAREQREFLLAQYYPYYAADFGRCHALGCPMYLAVVDEAEGIWVSSGLAQRPGPASCVCEHPSARGPGLPRPGLRLLRTACPAAAASCPCSRACRRGRRAATATLPACPAHGPAAHRLHRCVAPPPVLDRPGRADGRLEAGRRGCLAQRAGRNGGGSPVLGAPPGDHAARHLCGEQPCARWTTRAGARSCRPPPQTVSLTSPPAAAALAVPRRAPGTHVPNDLGSDRVCAPAAQPGGQGVCARRGVGGVGAGQQQRESL